jgi:hypothetical protein
MLSTSCLFFARADLLGDRFEGTLSAATVASRSQSADIAKELSPNLDVADMLNVISDATRRMREWTFVSCWHAGEYESAAMWSLYGRSVAVKSTYGRLRACVTSPSIRMGMVQYIDYARDLIPYDNSYWPFMYKRKSFEHEREVRIVIQDVQCSVYSSWANVAQHSTAVRSLSTSTVLSKRCTSLQKVRHGSEMLSIRSPENSECRLPSDSHHLMSPRCFRHVRRCLTNSRCRSLRSNTLGPRSSEGT